MNRALAALLALLVSGSAAAQILLLPAQPLVGEPVTVEFATPASLPCPAATKSSPYIGFDGTGPQGTGTVIYVEVANAPCGSPPVQTYTGRVSLGRLPVGPYTVRVRQASTDLSPPPPFATLAFNVVPSPLKFIDQDLNGHWLTDNAGEGVTIVQSQNKVFILFVTYDSSGRQRWFVAPDAKFDESGLSDDAPPRIFGRVYETSGFPDGPTPAGPGSLGNVANVGFLTITVPTVAHDRARMDFVFQSGGFRSVPLRRFHF